MRLVRIDVTVADSPEGPTIALEPEEAHFLTGDAVELVITGDAGATFAVDAVSFDDDGADSRFSRTRSDDGRRVIVSSSDEPVSVATYGYRVAVRVAGETIRSTGYPTVNQHPPIGG